MSDNKKKGQRIVKKIAYQSIALLNPPDRDHGASIRICARGNINMKGKWNDLVIEIRDCERYIILHGRLDTPKGKGDSLFKINTLINELTTAKEFLEETFKKEKCQIRPPLEQKNKI